MRAASIVLLTSVFAVPNTWAASLVSLKVRQSAAPEGDWLELSLLLAPNQNSVIAQVLAYEVAMPAEENARLQVRPVPGRGDFRDENGAFRLRQTITRQEDGRQVVTAGLVVPYDQLELPVGQHRVGYEIRIFHETTLQFSTASPLVFVTVTPEQQDMERTVFLTEVAIDIKLKTSFVVSPDGTIMERQVEQKEARQLLIPRLHSTRSKYTRGPDLVGTLIHPERNIAAVTADGRAITGRVLSPGVTESISILQPNNEVVKIAASDIKSLRVMEDSATTTVPEEAHREALVAELNRRPFIRQSRIPVYYATNRNIENNEWNPRRFGNDVGSTTYGSCSVSIPVTHRRGNFEYPDWWESPDPRKHVLIDQMNGMGSESFKTIMKTALTNRDDDDVLLYIHGFANSFESCVLTSARFKYDTEFTGPVVAFSWPSEGNTFSWINPKGPYRRDETKAKSSVDALTDLILDIVGQGTHRELGKLHVIAHSMGNQILLQAMKKVDRRLPAGDVPLGHLVLAAPDVDLRTFYQDYQALSRRSEDVTLYFCEDDRALKLSRVINNDSRVGQNSLKVGTLFNVDCKNANTSWIGHGYVVDRDILLVDLQMLLTQDRQPPQRLPPLGEKRNGNDPVYWYFP